MVKNKLLDFFELFGDINNFYIDPCGGTSILVNNPQLFEIDPREFLEYAYRDFELDDNRGYINALSNVKRSIECQSEIIHYSFGLDYKKLDFPTKIENVQKMGISPAVILKQIKVG